jgi:hypothetical protein
LLGFLDGWLDSANIDIAIKSVVNEHNWSPSIIDAMYLDSLDYHGIGYWYDNEKEMHDKMKKPGK